MSSIADLAVESEELGEVIVNATDEEVQELVDGLANEMKKNLGSVLYMMQLPKEETKIMLDALRKGMVKGIDELEKDFC